MIDLLLRPVLVKVELAANMYELLYVKSLFRVHSHYGDMIDSCQHKSVAFTFAIKKRKEVFKASRYFFLHLTRYHNRLLTNKIAVIGNRF